MNNEEKFKLIEKTIKDAKGDYSIDRLIQDCAILCSTCTRKNL